MKLLVIIFLLIINMSISSLAQETVIGVEEASLDEGKMKTAEDLSNLSTAELERRLDETEREIADLKIKAEYLRSEEPVYFDYSAGRAERTGFATQVETPSRLLNPTAAKDVEARLDRAMRLKETIEEELAKRDEPS